MKLITGLGNFGEKYRFTRHNAGFMALDYMSLNSVFPDFSFSYESKFKGEIAKVNHNGETLIFLKHHTYMNLSGEAVIAVMNFYKIAKEDLLVIHDDIDMPVGKIRFRAKGSDGGQKGIRSIIQVLGGATDFDRLKIGIGPQLNLSAEAYVLQNFSDEQMVELKDVLKRVEQAVDIYLKDGINAAQSKFN